MALAPVEIPCRIADSGKGGSSHSIMCYQWNADTPSSALPVFCVHGLSRNGRDFDYLARALSESRRVIAIDMPGRGKSDPLPEPSAYNYPAYVAQVEAVLRQLELTKVDWVGTSMGGIIAMMFAGAFPGVINRLVLNDIGCVVSAEGLRRILSNAGSSIVFSSRAEAEKELRVRCSTFGIKDEEHWQHLFTHSIIEQADGTFRFAYDPGILATFSSADEINDIDLWALWEPLTSVPIQLIRGAQSDILSHETAVAMKQRHPDLALHEMEGIGHVPALMDDEQVALVKNWLNQS